MSRAPQTKADSATSEDRAPSYAARIRIWYEDGTSSRLFNPNKPRLLFVFEQEFGHDAPETTSEGMWLFWHALGRPGDSFDAWIDTVEDVERISVELGKASS